MRRFAKNVIKTAAIAVFVFVYASCANNFVPNIDFEPSDSVVIPQPIPASAITSDGYWKNETDWLYYKATRGRGVDIVLVGDAWVHADFKKGGVWETQAKKIADDFMTVEVIRNFKSYFNVHILFYESAQKGATGSGSYFGGDAATAKLDSTKVWNTVSKFVRDRYQTAVMYIVQGSMGGWASRAGSNPGLACYSVGQEGNPMYWQRHEFVGHAFALLSDEYGSASNTDKRHPDYETDNGHGYDDPNGFANGNRLNIAAWPIPAAKNNGEKYYNNKLPPWKDFLWNPAYAREKIGGYEGGATVKLGRWRSTPDSYMNAGRTAGFNAISRYAIWMHIGVRAGLHPMEWYQQTNVTDRGSDSYLFNNRWPTKQSINDFFFYDRINL